MVIVWNIGFQRTYHWWKYSAVVTFVSGYTVFSSDVNMQFLVIQLQQFGLQILVQRCLQ